jgi:predicted dehydrogenase
MKKENPVMSTDNRLRVAIVGAGKFGTRRATAIAANSRSDIRVVADQVPDAAKKLAGIVGCSYSTSWEETVTREDVDAIVVSTSTQFLSTVTQRALAAGKHVLCEKPFGRSADEVRPVVGEAARRSICLKVGYNHRYHPAIAKAHALLGEGAIGGIQFMRCLYGHGGRPGYEREWRANPEFSGGGQLLDQGVHALDLFRWFAGEFCEVKAYVATSYWPIAPAEDNVFGLLRTEGGCLASLHASWTNWKNVFSFEVFGENGYLSVTGLGGHYGPERLCWGQRHTVGAKPEERWFDYNEQDRSLEDEWSDFLDCIAEGRQPPSSGEESLKTLELVEAIYHAARLTQGVAVAPSTHQPIPMLTLGEDTI